MTGHQDKIIRYKWDSRTESGYRLRYDARRARHTGLRCFRVEEWAQHCKVDEWGFDSLGEALEGPGSGLIIRLYIECEKRADRPFFHA